MNFSGTHGVAILSTASRSNWNLETMVFVEGGKLVRVPGEKPSEQGQEPTTNSPHI